MAGGWRGGGKGERAGVKNGFRVFRDVIKCYRVFEWCLGGARSEVLRFFCVFLGSRCFEWFSEV